jgi:hypothetical protein
VAFVWIEAVTILKKAKMKWVLKNGVETNGVWRRIWNGAGMIGVEQGKLVLWPVQC